MFNAVQAYAQSEGNIQSLIIDVGGLINVLTGVAFALALLVFFWGLAVFIFQTGDESRVSDGKRLMIWGIIALFVATSIWGIVALLQETFGAGGDTPIERGVDDVFPFPDTA